MIGSTEIRIAMYIAPELVRYNPLIVEIRIGIVNFSISERMMSGPM